MFCSFVTTSIISPYLLSCLNLSPNIGSPNPTAILAGQPHGLCVVPLLWLLGMAAGTKPRVCLGGRRQAVQRHTWTVHRREVTKETKELKNSIFVVSRFESDLESCKKFLARAEALMTVATGDDRDNLEFFQVAISWLSYPVIIATCLGWGSDLCGRIII